MKFQVDEASKKRAGVYLISATGSSALYVGATKNLYSRYNAHLLDLKSGRHINARLLQVASDVGIENMTFTLLELWDKEESLPLARLEEKWIAHYDTGDLLNRGRTSGIKEPAPVKAMALGLPLEMHEKLRFLAKKDRRAFPDYLRLLLGDHIAAHEKEFGPIELPPSPSIEKKPE